MAEKYCCNNMNFFWEGAEKMKTRDWSKLILFSKLPSLSIYYKIQHIHFLVHGQFLLVHIQFTQLGQTKEYIGSLKARV